ncbi:GNAT family N-acetyltransferase [Dokdonella sp.]|uniref:GNAT family N-acetyltransferase n=1 Tax=Dokdonella sp. TaxID=2291710 RepID=UPI001B23BA90|nr:GNAT family N-acetyltransferase [Dokdonella sp.]MBO9661894.1 GNAT family N-acetyltransferase [Dokdonella sp.]
MLLRPYTPDDWHRLCEIHDRARIGELRAAGLEAAYLTLEQTAENEGLFDGAVTVAVLDGEVQGFAAVRDGELTWLYVIPHMQGRGIGRALLRHAIDACDGDIAAEVLLGNDAALQLYRSEGFAIERKVDGRLAGNERFAASGHYLRRGASGVARPPSDG